MEDNSFIIDAMTWSFSRINAFGSKDSCKKEWYDHYISCEPSMNSFDGQAGSCIHSVLEAYFKGEISEFDMPQIFEERYKREVTIPCAYPNGDTKFPKIMEYLENFSFDRETYEVLGVEKKVEFKIGEYNCIGFIDLLLRNKNTGEITLMDHKTSSIRFTKSGKVSKSDEEHLKAFIRQQYLYSKVILEEYGRVDFLKWNMVKDQDEICIPWKKEEMDETFKWAEDTIKSIEKETEFPPNPSYYYCTSLCSCRGNGCPYKRLGMIYDGIYAKCYNPKNKDFFEYGAAGIEMCEDWKNDKQEFFKWALESGYEDDLILKRYDEEQGYDFFNCYWDTRDIKEDLGYGEYY